MIRLDTFVGEIGKVWEITINKSDGTPRDLTGATIELVVERQTTLAGMIISAGFGRVDFTVVDGSYPNAGVFAGRFKTSGLTGGITTFTEEVRVNVAAVPFPAS